jgi:hypothetical protein
MQNDDPDNNDSDNKNNPSINADEPEKPETPYTAPDGREHILDFDDEKINIKSPQSDNNKK